MQRWIANAAGGTSQRLNRVPRYNALAVQEACVLAQLKAGALDCGQLCSSHVMSILVVTLQGGAVPSEPRMVAGSPAYV